MPHRWYTSQWIDSLLHYGDTMNCHASWKFRMGDRLRNHSIQQDMSSLQILDDILRTTTASLHTTPPPLEPAPGLIPLPSLEPAMQERVKSYTPSDNLEPWSKLLPPVFPDHYAGHFYPQFNNTLAASRSIMPSINDINSIVGGVMTNCKNEVPDDSEIDPHCHSVTHDGATSAMTSSAVTFDTNSEASHICCNSTELMAAIRQDIVSSGIASLSGESGRSMSHDSPAISPTLSPTTDTLSAAAGAPMISTDAGEETDSLNDSHASSVDTTPYKRFFDQTDNASSPLEPLDLPHLLPRKRVRRDDEKAPYSHAVSSHHSQSMSMDHILSVPYTTSNHVYTYPAAQQGMAWNGVMYPTFNSQVSAQGVTQTYPVGIPQHVAIATPAQANDLLSEGVTAPLSIPTSRSEPRHKGSQSKSSDRKRKSPTESLTSPSEENKPTAPYVELIAMAILSCDEKRMLIADIYQWLMNKYPYFTEANERSWRNSVRHNLSLMKCFVKGDRAPNGRGFYWSIADQFQGPFSKGDFNVTGCKERKKSAESSRNKKYFHLITACNSKTPPAGSLAPHGLTPAGSLSQHGLTPFAALRDCSSVPITQALPRSMITVSVAGRPHSTPIAPNFSLPGQDTLLTFAQPLQQHGGSFMSPDSAIRDVASQAANSSSNIIRTTNPSTNTGTNTTFTTLNPQQAATTACTLRPHSVMPTAFTAFPTQFGTYQSPYFPYYGQAHYLPQANQPVSPTSPANQSTSQLAPANQSALGYYPGIYSPCTQQQPATAAVFNMYESGEWLSHT